MKNCFFFFKNTECEYFPCHKLNDKENFNCLFCYCPLYSFEDCGGVFTFTENGIKDCSDCLIPHDPKNYNLIISRIKNKP